MLNLSKTITINAYSTHENTTVVTYTATIDSNKPEIMSPSIYVQDSALYRTHREECNEERVQFEDAAFAIQEEAIAEKKSKEHPE